MASLFINFKDDRGYGSDDNSESDEVDSADEARYSDVYEDSKQTPHITKDKDEYHLWGSWNTAREAYDDRINTFQRQKIRQFFTLKEALEQKKTMKFTQTAVFAPARPRKPRVDDRRLNYSKSYLVGGVGSFFRAFYSMQSPIVADEVVYVQPGVPIPLYFDVEIKREGNAKWNHRDNIDKYFLKGVVGILRKLIGGLGVDVEGIDEGLINTLAAQYAMLSNVGWTEDDCTAGLSVICRHISDRLEMMLGSRIGDDEIDGDCIPRNSCKAMHVSSGCREDKLSFHIVMDDIYCDHQCLSMPLVVHDIKGWFLKDNVEWLLSNPPMSAERRFRTRALMLNEQLLSAGEETFAGGGGTPFDEAVYSHGHLLRCVMSSKARLLDMPMIPLKASSSWHPRCTARNSAVGASSVMVNDSKKAFSQIFDIDTKYIDEWRRYNVTCRHLDNGIDRIFLISKLNPGMWTYFHSKSTWYSNRRKYGGDVCSVNFGTLDYVGAVVTQLYASDSGVVDDRCRHYDELRPVVVTEETGGDVAGVQHTGPSLLCDLHDKVKIEDHRVVRLYQLNHGQKFFCGRRDEKSASATFHRGGYGLSYTCFCTHCRGATYYSTPPEHRLECMERRFPYTDDETVRSDDANAKFRKFDSGQAYVNEGHEKGRDVLMDRCSDAIKQKLDWETIVRNALSGADDKSPQFHVIDAPCESGKTFEMQQLVENVVCQDGRYVYVVHRRSLADDIYSSSRREDALAHYKHCDGAFLRDNEDMDGKLTANFVIVYNSLYKFGNGRADVVILDEIGALRRHIVGKTTRPVLPAAQKRFVRLIREAKVVVMLQHLISLEDVQMITSFANVDPTDRTYVNALQVVKPHEMHPLTVTYRHSLAMQLLLKKYCASFEAPHCVVREAEEEEVEYDEEEEEESVGRDIWFGAPDEVSTLTPATIMSSSGEIKTTESSHGNKKKRCYSPFIVFCTQKKASLYIVERLKKKAIEIGADAERIKLVTSSMKDKDPWNLLFFESPNERAGDCDVLVATSVIGVGISLNNHFGSFVGFLYNGILTVDEEWQFIHRCRFGAKLSRFYQCRDSFLWIEKGHGRGCGIDVHASMEEGRELHNALCRDINGPEAVNDVLDLQQLTHFGSLNRAYWTDFAERQRDASNKHKLWEALLSESLRPDAYRILKDEKDEQACGFSAAVLQGEDRTYQVWKSSYASRVSRALSIKNPLVTEFLSVERGNDAALNELLANLSWDDVLPVAMGVQASECCTDWSKAFPGGIEFVSAVIKRKLEAPYLERNSILTNTARHAIAGKLKSHLSGKCWKNRYARHSCSLCVWIGYFYTSLCAEPELFWGKSLCGEFNLHKQIGGEAVLSLVRMRVCGTLLPLIFTSSPSELRYILTDAQSPFYIGLRVRQHASLCAFFRRVIGGEEVVKGESDGKPEEAIEGESDSKLDGDEFVEGGSDGEVDHTNDDTGETNGTDPDPVIGCVSGVKMTTSELRNCVQYVLRHHRGSLRLEDLYQSAKSAHQFVQYLCRLIGFELKTKGKYVREKSAFTMIDPTDQKDKQIPVCKNHITPNLKTKGKHAGKKDKKIPICENHITPYDLVLAFASPPAFRTMFIDMLPTLFSKSNVPKEGLDLIREAVAIHNDVIGEIDDTRRNRIVLPDNEILTEQVSQREHEVALLEQSVEASKECDHVREKTMRRVVDAAHQCAGTRPDELRVGRTVQSLDGDRIVGMCNVTPDLGFDASDNCSEDLDHETLPRALNPFVNDEAGVDYAADNLDYRTSGSFSDGDTHVSKSVNEFDSDTFTRARLGSHSEFEVDCCLAEPDDDDDYDVSSSTAVRSSVFDEVSVASITTTATKRNILKSSTCLSPQKKKGRSNVLKTPVRDSESNKFGYSSKREITPGRKTYFSPPKARRRCGDGGCEESHSFDWIKPVEPTKICRVCRGCPDHRCGTCGLGIKHDIFKLPVSNTSTSTSYLRPPPEDWNPDLVSPDSEIVKEAVHGHGDDKDVLAVCDSDSVTRESMRRLQPGEWLNDEIINYFVKYCLTPADESMYTHEPTRRRSHFFNSFFVQTLFNDKNDNQQLRGVYNYKNVRRWSRKVPEGDIFELNCLFFPINEGNLHWVSVCVFFDLKEIHYYDSKLPKDGEVGQWSKTRLFGIAQYIEDEYDAKHGGVFDWSGWKVVQPKPPQQPNGEFITLSLSLSLSLSLFNLIVLKLLSDKIRVV